VDAELQHLYEESSAAWAAFDKHRLSAFVARYQSGSPVGTGDVPALGNPDYWKRYDELRAAADRADRTWRDYTPRRA
jgi:hypothetical protein